MIVVTVMMMTTNFVLMMEAYETPLPVEVDHDSTNPQISAQG
jgi:hypothetical protein